METALSAVEVRELRRENSRKTFDGLKKYNNKKLHNDKDPETLTTPLKAEKAVAKKRKVLLKKLGDKGDEEVCEVIGELIGSGERTLSAGPLETSPNTTLIRLERSMDN